MTTYTSPFTGTAIQPTDVSFAAVTLAANLQLYWPAYVNAGQQVAARIMEFTATTTGLAVSLPDATQASDGQDILIRNTGANAFTVNRFGGTGSFSVAPGQSYYTYITNNTTQAGTWAVLQFGTGTSAADAASLAGSSTTAVLGHLETAFPASEYTNPPTIVDATRGQCLVWTDGAASWTLPAVSTLSQGWFILVRNNGSGALTINTSSVTSLIDGLGSITLQLGDSCFICVDRDPAKQDFFTVGRARPNSLTFSSATYDVDNISGNALSLISNTPIIQRYTALSGSRSASLLVTLPAVTQVYYLLNDTNQNGYAIEFQVQGSTQLPFNLYNGTQAIVLSDGTNMYPLIQANIGVQLLNNGSAAAPSLSFTSDTTTGVYLPNSGQLGFSTGGVNIATMDGSLGVGNFVTRFVGRVQADLIAGGSY